MGETKASIDTKSVINARYVLSYRKSFFGFLRWESNSREVRKSVVVPRSRCERVYKRTGAANEDFCGKEEQRNVREVIFVAKHKKSPQAERSLRRRCVILLKKIFCIFNIGVELPYPHDVLRKRLYSALYYRWFNYCAHSWMDRKRQGKLIRETI